MREDSKKMWCVSQDWPFCLQTCQHCDLELQALSTISNIFLLFKNCSVYGCLLWPRRDYTRLKLLYSNFIGASGSGWVDTHPHSLEEETRSMTASNYTLPATGSTSKKSLKVRLNCCSILDFPLWEDPSWVWGERTRKAAENLLEILRNARSSFS